MASVDYELMFVSIKAVTAKAADAIDLAIEFSTLGEYGLEYPKIGRTANSSALGCRPGRTRAKPATRTRADRPAPAGSEHRSRRVCSEAAPTVLPEALRPPRITLDLKD